MEKGLHRGLTEAAAPLMGPRLIGVLHPLIEVGLQLLDAPVDLLAEGDAAELIEQRIVESLTDPVRLRVLVPVTRTRTCGSGMPPRMIAASS